jgi:uncharacterized protein
MSAEDNLSTVKAIYEAFGRGDVATILKQLTDDVDWATDAALPAAPWYGQKRGKDEVRSFFEAIAGSTTVQEFTPLAFAANDDEVMVLIRYRVTVNATGREVEMNLHHYWRFRDGKIDYVRSSEDTALVAAAFAG